VASARLLVALVLGIFVSACTHTAAASPSESPRDAVDGIGPHTAVLASEAPGSSLEVAVLEATYGHLVIKTRPGSICVAKTELPSGGTVLAGDFLASHTANADGLAAWSYGVPVAGAGSGIAHYAITCAAGAESAELTASFEIAAH
jgi:hypothetical protein